MALSPEEQAAWSQMTGKPYQGSNWMSYIPNVFGGVPAGFEGLLGAEQAQQISQRSNIAGLLGAAAALAQGMGSQGPRRSAIQNVLGALGAGYGTAGQVAQQGLQNIGLQYEIAQKQLSQGQTLQRQQAISQLLQTPEIANDPAMRAWVLNNPDKATEYFAQRNAMEAYRRSRMPKPQPAAPVAEAMPVPMPGEGLDITAPGQAIPPIVERPQPIQTAQTITPKVSELQAKIDSADIDADYYTSIGKLDEAKKSQDIAANLRAQARKEGLVNQVDPQLDAVFPTLKKRVESLKKRAPNMTQEQIVSEQNDILKADAKLLEDLDPTLQAAEIKRRRAQATVIDMGSREMEKEFAKGVVEDTRASFAQAKSASNTLGTINRLRPVIQAGVYDSFRAGVPRSVDQMATAMGVTGKDTQEKLQRTAVAMQQLASLELQAAEAMKGQGAITENERTLIARAAGGNLRDFTAGEVQALLSSLEKVAQQKISSHQANYELMSQDPVASKYSKYYKIEAPKSPVKKYNPATGRIE